MSLLYLMKFSVEYRGLTQKELIANWLQEAETAIAAKEKGRVTQIWKVVGERKVIAVLKVDSPQALDMVSFNLPMMKLMGDQVHLEMTPLRPYEGFANDVSKLLGESSSDFQDLDPVPKDGLFYWLTFTIEYEGMSQEDLFKVWAEEAKAALGAKKKGTVVDLWKVVGERKVHALLCVSSPYELDLISFNLPIMKQIGDKVHIQCTSLRPYETFYQDLKKLSSS